jgi:hypothetical protein
MILILLVIGCSDSKTNNTEEEALDEWVEAFNFLSSKEYGLLALLEEISLPSSDEAEADIDHLKLQIENARSKEPPDMLRDLYGRFLAGIDLLEEGINAYEEKDYQSSLSNFESGLDTLYRSTEMMLNRVTEESPFETE